jgi:hypothetical protein
MSTKERKKRSKKKKENYYYYCKLFSGQDKVELRPKKYFQIIARNPEIFTYSFCSHCLPYDLGQV